MTATWASLVVGLGLWLSGLTVQGLLRPRRRRTALEWHATAVALGLAFLPALYTTAAVLTGGPLPRTPVLIVFGLLALPGLVFVRPPRGMEGGEGALVERREPWTLTARVLAVATVLFCGFAAFYAASMPMHVFDPVFHFAYKGKVLLEEGFFSEGWRDLDGPVGRVMTHPNYPPAIPALHALLAHVYGAFDEDATRALMALYAIVPAAWLWVALSERSRVAAGSAALLWISLPILYYTRPPHTDFLPGALGLILGVEPAQAIVERILPGTDATEWKLADGWTLDGAGDLPLAAMFFGAFWYVWRCLRGSGEPSDRADAATAGLLLGGACLTKNEGLALTLILALALGLTLLVQRKQFRDEQRGAGAPGTLGTIALTFGHAAACSAAWLAIRGAIPGVDENYPDRLKPDRIVELLHRTPTVAGGFLDTFTYFLRWDLCWPLFFATIAWTLLRPSRLVRSRALPALLTVLGAFALYFAILIVTPWNLESLFTTVIPGRLVLHVTPIAIFATLVLLWRRPEEA